MVLSCVCLAGAQPLATDQVRLTTVEAPWVVVIEKLGGIENIQVALDGRSGYFLMSPNSSGLNVSMFIEPAEKCKTSETCRDFVLQKGNPAWGKFQDLSKAEIGSFSYFEFYRPTVMDRPLKMLDLFAQFVGDGYWIDLHISKEQYKKEDHRLFEELVRSVRFLPKKRGSPEPDKAISAIQGATDKWLTLWGSGKCKESYSALTSISKEAIDEGFWVDYCDTVNQGLGKVVSRNLVAAVYMRSLPPKPDRSGATLRYHSVFPTGPMLEFVSLTTEKNGSWTVSNYLAPLDVDGAPPSQLIGRRVF